MPEQKFSGNAGFVPINTENQATNETGCCDKKDNCGEISEAVCIDASRVFDSCADKDCLADLQVYFTNEYQPIIDCATSVRCKKSEILTCYIDVEPVAFNKGFYCVDITYFFKIKLDAYSVPIAPPVTVEGLAMFSKKCILYGSDGNVKVFSSENCEDEFNLQNVQEKTSPKAKVQAVDPICLGAKICENVCCDPCCVPVNICKCFKGEFSCAKPEKTVLVTLGLFSIVQLERDVQLLMPAYNYCIPEKECCFSVDEPCDVFKKIKFPIDEFYPVKNNPSENNYGNCCSDDN